MFYKGDRVRCIDNDDSDNYSRSVPLTIGKIYTCLEDARESQSYSDKKVVRIENDSSRSGLYLTNRFVIESCAPIDILATFKDPKIDYFAINREVSSL